MKAAARAFGKMAAGKKKNFSIEERRLRAERMRAINKKRSGGVAPRDKSD
jgi:hypothetical protein